MERNGATSVSWKAGLAGGLLLALSPALAVAQQLPYATGVLHEIREGINCNPGDSTAPNCAPAVPEAAKGFGVRIADGTLTGNIVGPPPFSGPVTIEASSVLNQRDWTGPVNGKMMLDSGARATFSGRLNLSLAVFAGEPLAPISGKWQGTRGTLQAGGDFNGVFLVPFPCPMATGLAGLCYLAIDANGKPTGVTPLGPDDFSLTGVPLVKLVVAFFNN